MCDEIKIKILPIRVSIKKSRIKFVFQRTCNPNSCLVNCYIEENMFDIYNV